MADSPTVWCPSCGAEYRGDVAMCSDCRVATVTSRDVRLPEPDAEDLVELGEWPRLTAQILRARLETAGIDVMAEWSGPGADAMGTLSVPAGSAEFGAAVINEIDVEDEVPDVSPFAYVTRLEEHLAASAELLMELRTRLDELEADGKL